MLFAEYFFFSSKSLAIQLLGFSILTLALKRFCEVVDTCECIGMVFPEYFFFYSKSLPIQLLGFSILALAVKRFCEAVDACECIGMVFPKRPLPHAYSIL